MQCPQCQSPTDSYPSGISKKTGKPYSARIACTNTECGWVKWEPRPRAQTSRSNQAPAGDSVFQQPILERLALRLENIDLYLKKLSDNYEALATFFRQIEDKGEPFLESGNGDPIGEGGIGVRLSERLYKQDMPTSQNTTEQIKKAEV